MTPLAPPNTWVSAQDPPATQLTYALRVNPAPLTVSVPKHEPTLGSIELVITNTGVEDVALAAMTLGFTVGPPGPGPGATLMQTTTGAKTAVSDQNTWHFSDMPKVESGDVSLVLSPQVEASAPVGAGASVVVQVYDFHTVEVPCTTTVTVQEEVPGQASEPLEFKVTTFPDGFYFNGLVAAVNHGSGYEPVAQVPAGSKVTLFWNSSVVNTKGQTVLWSDAQGQREATPSELGRWVTPGGVSSDTVFVVVVKLQGIGGEPLTAALATAVAVKDPVVTAGTVRAGSVEAGSATVTGLVDAKTVKAGELNADGAAVTGRLVASEIAMANAMVSEKLQGAALAFESATVSGPLSARDVTVTRSLTLLGNLRTKDGHSTITLEGGLAAVALQAGFLGITSSGAALGAMGRSPAWPVGRFENGAGREGNIVTGVYSKVQGDDWGLYTNGRMGSDRGDALITHLPTGDGYRVVTSPLSLEPEVHASGEARLAGGRATVELDPDVAAIVAGPYRVLVTPTERCNGLAVTAKAEGSFEVEELLDGTGDAAFDWLLIGRKAEAPGSNAAAVLPDALPQAPEASEAPEPPPESG